jgi:hypothetical protein
MKIGPLTVFLGMVCLVGTGCGPSKTERKANERERLALEEQARREAAAGNKAITDMTEKAFRRRTPEEEAKHKEEVARQVQEILMAQEAADAKAANPTSKP